MSAGIDLENVCCDFGTFRAVDNANVSIKPGEFFSFLGPSGCGKTTILRMVSGFIEPTAGAIKIGGKDVKGTRPNQRPTALIFQNLALFPLMPIWENISFGLEVRGGRQGHAAEEGRGPVEVGRPARCRRQDGQPAVGRPEAACGDCPCVGGRTKRSCSWTNRSPLSTSSSASTCGPNCARSRSGPVSLSSTSPMTRAKRLAMSDRVGVMSQGRIQQIAAPRDIYDNPVNGFVASFVGENNIFEGEVGPVADGMAAMTGPHGSFRARISARGAGQGAQALRPARAYGSDQVEGHRELG